MTFPHTIEILAKSPATSALGGTSYGHAATGQKYQAYIQHRTESLQMINETGGVMSNVVIYAEPACVVSNYDRITFDGKTFEVIGVMPMYTPSGLHHIKITAVELSQT